MTESSMDPQTRDNYEKQIENYRTSGVLETAVGLAKSLDVELPKGIEQVATNPEAAMDWAMRALKIEGRFRTQIGGELDAVSNEDLRNIQLNPIDVQGAKLCFVQFYSRFMLETSAAQNDDATPEKISLIRGGGKPFEEFLAGKVYPQPKGENELERAMKHLEILEAAQLLNPIDGVIRSGKLVVFINRVERANKLQG